MEFSFRFLKITNTRRSYQLEGIMDICSYIIQRNRGIQCNILGGKNNTEKSAG